jgi:NDP-4-keto-2,6-dideoxyhexose 3-C-methyltransferase
MKIHGSRTTCRSCEGSLTQVLDLGVQRLADFRDDDIEPPAFPLVLMFCEDCGLAQLDTTVPRQLMYHERYGFKSGVNDSIRRDHQSIVRSTLKKIKAKSWLDIACNDGTLLSCVPKDIYRAGCDPVLKYAKEACQHANHISPTFFPVDYHGRTFDVVSSISMFYDVDDPNEFVKGIKKVLDEDGVWVVQQNYLGDTIELNAVDNVCHEHITYWSLIAFQKLLHRHGLEVFDVEFSKVNGGCIRTFVARKGKYRVEESVIDVINYEYLSLDLHEVKTLERWSERVGVSIRNLKVYVDHLNDKGKRVAIYGASTRGGTIWQAAGLIAEDFCYAVDRNPEKVGKTMSSIGLSIVSEEVARADKPDYMICSIWFFRDEVLKREKDYQGKWIFPLPDFEVVG